MPHVTPALLRFRFRSVPGLLCFALGTVVTSVVLAAYSLDYVDQLRLLGTLFATLLLPGALIACSWPAPSRERGALATFGLAYVCGMGPQLAGWALAVRSGHTWWLWLGPWLLTLPVLAVLELLARRRRPREPEAAEAPTAPADEESGTRGSLAAQALLVPLITLASWLLLLRSMAAYSFATNLVERPTQWNQDLYWHLALSAEATHAVPLRDPQSAVEGNLSYHWFANAHAAALSMASGVDLEPVSTIAWLVPCFLAAVGLVSGFTRYLTGSRVASAVAVVLVALQPTFAAAQSLDLAMAKNGLVWLSHSHIYSLPLAIALTWLLVIVCRRLWFGPGSGWTPSAYALLAYLAVLAPGSKVSLLPTLMGGLGVFGLMGIIRRRAWKPSLLMGVVAGVIVLFTSTLFAGGGGGSVPAFAATVRQLSLFKASRFPHDLQPMNYVLIAAMALMLLVSFAPLLVSIVPSPKRDRGSAGGDPALWIFGGMMLVAMLAVMGLMHPSLSQVYFLRGLAPIICVYMAAGLFNLVRWHAESAQRRRSWVVGGTVLACALVIGLVWSDTTKYAADYRVRSFWAYPGALLACVGAAVLIYLLRRRAGSLATLVAAGLVLGYGLASPVREVLDKPIPTASAAPRKGNRTLSMSEVEGARALARINTDAALVATNVHCLMEPRTQPHCDARAFWVAGLGHSPVFIGGWAYSASARKDHGKEGYSYLRQNYFDQSLYALNQKAFASPTPEVLAHLKDRGVRYLFADTKASPVSSRLSELAKPVWHEGDAAIFQLK